MDFKREFMRAMDREGIRYSDEGEFKVTIKYRGDNTDSIAINVFFDKDGDGLVALKCWSFGHIPDNKRAVMLECCNELNTKWRWVKFYIDGDGDISLSLDAVIDIDTVGPEVIQLVNRMVDIYDKSYPTLMSRLWGAG